MDENPRITDLRKKLEKDPGSRLFGQLAEELRKDGKYDEAIAVARRGLEKNPNYPSARLTLGRALLDSGRPREARPELEQVVKTSPDNILAGRLLGDALEELGEQAEAIQQLERTLVFSPGDKAMTEKLAVLQRNRAAMRADEVRRAAAVAPPVEPVRSPEPLPKVASSATLDRDLASRPFSPGSQTAGDLQRRSALEAAEPRVADPGLAETLGFGEMEASIFGMEAAGIDTAETMSLPLSPAPAAADRAEFFQAAPRPDPPPSEMPPSEMLPDDPDLGGQTLPLTSVTLADLYLQQGLKAEASAVLSQLVKDEPTNAQARSKLAAVLEPEERRAQIASAASAPVPPMALTPIERPAPQNRVTRSVARPSRTKAAIRERTILSLKAFKDAAEREAVHQTASEFSIR